MIDRYTTGLPDTLFSWTYGIINLTGWKGARAVSQGFQGHFPQMLHTSGMGLIFDPRPQNGSISVISLRK